VLDRPALLAALDGQTADAVISELTALKKTPMAHRDMAATNRLRTEGTANLIAAARHVGARRFVTQSMVFGYGYGDWGGRVLTEADQFGPPGRGQFERHLAAMRENEQQVFTSGLDGIALRYGLFYGPGPAGADMIEQLRRRRLPIVRHSGVQPWVYIDDAAAATVAALERGEPGSAYNIADDEPVSLAVLLTALAEAIDAPPPRRIPGWLLAATPYGRSIIRGGLRVSNAKAAQELGWILTAPTYRDGVRLLAAHAKGN
jgi:nucleoside-diphosphate-sugar epimerase